MPIWATPNLITLILNIIHLISNIVQLLPWVKVVAISDWPSLVIKFLGILLLLLLLLSLHSSSYYELSSTFLPTFIIYHYHLVTVYGPVFISLNTSSNNIKYIQSDLLAFSFYAYALKPDIQRWNSPIECFPYICLAQDVKW